MRTSVVLYVSSNTIPHVPDQGRCVTNEKTLPEQEAGRVHDICSGINSSIDYFSTFVVPIVAMVFGMG